MAVKMETMKVRLTFTEAILGTWPNNPDIAAEYIATKAPNYDDIEKELEALPAEDLVKKGMTVFPRTPDGTPALYDYQVKGFLKDTVGMLRKVKGSVASGFKAYKKEIDGLVFVSPRMIPIQFDGDIGSCQRPLRASTPQGERVSLANSEEIPAGATIELEFGYYNEQHRDLIIECLDYGQLRGIGQWRNSGKGRFTWELLN